MVFSTFLQYRSSINYCIYYVLFCYLSFNILKTFLKVYSISNINLFFKIKYLKCALIYLRIKIFLFDYFHSLVFYAE